MQGVQVQLVPEPGREALHGLGRVVAAAVEAAVDQGLDPAAQGWNRAATVRVAPATARLPEPWTSLEAVGTTSTYGMTSRAVTSA